MNRAHRRAAIALALCCALAHVPRRAAAQSAQTLLQEALVNFRVGKFRASVKALTRARRKTKDASVLGRIMLQLGVSRGAMKQLAKAEAAFEKALNHDPTVTLKPGQANDAVIKLLARVRARLKGALKVSADRGSGAVVRVDGKPVGKTPFARQLAVGKHAVEVESVDKLYRYRGELVVRVSGKHQVRVKLAFVGGWLTVTSKPAGATVRLAGKRLGVTPLKRVALRPGTHELTLALDGHRAGRKKVTVAKGEQATAQVTLDPIAVASAPTSKPKQAPKASPAAAGADSDARPSRRRIWTWVALGGAAIAAGVAIGLGVSVKSDYDEYKSTNDPARFDELTDALPTKVRATNAMWGVAGALAAASVVLFFLEGRSPERKTSARSASGSKHTVRVAPLVGPTSGAVMQVRF